VELQHQGNWGDGWTMGGRGDTGEGAVEEPTDSADVEVELR